MGLFDFLTTDSANKMRNTDASAYVDPTDPRIQALLMQRAQGQLSPQEQANVANQQVQAQNLVAGQAAAARGTNAGLAQRNSIMQGANAASSVAGQAQQVAQAGQAGATNSLNNIAQANRESKVSQTQFDTGNYNKAMAADIADKNTTNREVFGKAIGGFSTWLASDENLKENIKPADAEVKSFLDHLKGWKYDYKNPEIDGSGEKVSVMAQDLEKSSIGQQAVHNTERGKMVDYQSLMPALLAATAELNKRMTKMEK